MWHSCFCNHTHKPDEGDFSAGILSSLINPQMKNLVQEHYSCAWTYQDWCHSSELQHRDHFSTQDSHDKLTAIDGNALPQRQPPRNTPTCTDPLTAQQAVTGWILKWVRLNFTTCISTGHTGECIWSKQGFKQASDITLMPQWLNYFICQFHTQIMLMSSTGILAYFGLTSSASMYSQHKSKTRVLNYYTQ